MPTWSPSAIWLGLLVLFAVLEGATATLVSVWFCAGALIALLCSLLTTNVSLQVFLFFLVSVASMLTLRSLARRYVLPSWVPTNADRVIGREAVVIEDIDNLAGKGAALVFGVAWTARSETGEPIPKDTVVTVRRIEGVKLFVSPSGLGKC